MENQLSDSEKRNGFRYDFLDFSGKDPRLSPNTSGVISISQLESTSFGNIGFPKGNDGLRHLKSFHFHWNSNCFRYDISHLSRKCLKGTQNSSVFISISCMGFALFQNTDLLMVFYRFWAVPDSLMKRGRVGPQFFLSPPQSMNPRPRQRK